MSKHKAGQVFWVDLTVKNAEQVRDFYKEVVGWNSSEVDMGGYSDYNMNLEDGKTIAGICHSHGLNANLPPQWLIYITVSNLEKTSLVAKLSEERLSTAHGPWARACSV